MVPGLVGLGSICKSHIVKHTQKGILLNLSKPLYIYSRARSFHWLDMKVKTAGSNKRIGKLCIKYATAFDGYLGISRAFLSM